MGMMPAGMSWWKRITQGPQVEGIEWILEAAEALVAEWGIEAIRTAPLVLPTDEFYPVDMTDPEAAVLRTFELTVDHAGLREWPLRLVRESEFSQLRAFGRITQTVTKGAVSSGLQFDGSTEPPTYLVTYVEDDLASPDGFVYHCVQQLAAALVWTRDEIPGGDEAFWYFVDVTACLMGFGVFACNASFICQGYQDENVGGFWWQRRGMLSTEQLAACLALFTLLRGLSPATVKSHLSPTPRASYATALTVLKKRHRERVEAMGGMPGVEGGRLSFVLPEAGRLTVAATEE